MIAQRDCSLLSLAVRSGLLLAGLPLLSGCAGFFTAQNPPTPAVNFSTITQPYDDAINLNKLPFIPRPHQPLMGQFQNANTGSLGTGHQFGSAFSAPYTTYTDKNGELKENGLEVNSNWDLYYNWLPIGGCVSSNPAWDGHSAANEQYLTDPNNPVALTSEVTGTGTYPDVTVPPFTCNMLITDLETVSPQVVTSTPPATLSITYGKDPSINPIPPGPLAGYAVSQISLYVYDQTAAQVATATAKSISTDGYTAVFNFPKTSAGAALPNGMYGTTIVNGATTQFPQDIGGESYFFIGSISSNYVGAFGVATASSHYQMDICPTGSHLHSQCDISNTTSHFPVVTSLTSGKLYTLSGSTAVGSLPVAVVTYGSYSYSQVVNSGGETGSIDGSGTGYALVVNEGSNNVSVVGLQNSTVTATIPVGQAPVAAAVDSAAKYAYVANYRDNTVSKLSLSTFAVVGTISVGASPTSVTLDASGNLWVGGNGFIKEFNSTTYALIRTSAVTGIVNSLAISQKQNRVVSTIVQPAGSGVTTPQAMIAASVIGGTQNKTPLTSSATAYTTSSVASYLPTPYLLGGGSQVSVNFGNNLSISATPTGYVVQDVYTGAVLLAGTTSAPVRGIAVDQTYGYAYLTIPDTNSVITVPIP